MFSLTVLDHVRLDSEHASQNYMVHARAADRFARFAFAARLIMTVLLAAAVAAAVANLVVGARFYQIAAIVSSVAALAGFALYSIFGFEARVSAHRDFAHRLWIVCQRYRSLVTEAAEEVIDRSTLLERRDELILQVHAIYERGFAVDQRAYEATRLPALPSERAA